MAVKAGPFNETPTVTLRSETLRRAKDLDAVIGNNFKRLFVLLPCVYLAALVGGWLSIGRDWPLYPALAVGALLVAPALVWWLGAMIESARFTREMNQRADELERRKAAGQRW